MFLRRRPRKRIAKGSILGFRQVRLTKLRAASRFLASISQENSARVDPLEEMGTAFREWRSGHPRNRSPRSWWSERGGQPRSTGPGVGRALKIDGGRPKASRASCPGGAATPPTQSRVQLVASGACSPIRDRAASRSVSTRRRRRRSDCPPRHVGSGVRDDPGAGERHGGGGAWANKKGAEGTATAPRSCCFQGD